jgi:Zn-dependent protease
VLIPLFSILATGRVFIAWAKPVPIDPRNFSNFKRDDSLVTAAGPISNFVMAFLCSLMVIVIHYITTSIDVGVDSIAFEFLNFLFKMFASGIFLNVTLALFNMIPVPPLDGSHLLANLMPEEMAFRYRQIGFFGIFIILALFNFIPGFSKIFMTVIVFFVRPYLNFIELFIPNFTQIYFS